MDFSKKIRFPNSGRSDSQRNSPKTNKKISHESNENSFSPRDISHNSRNEHRNSKSPFTSPSLQKRILADKNNLSKSLQKSSPQEKTDSPLPVSTYGSRPDSPYPLPYDPVTNYTSPRPVFLRYDPNRRMEIMMRVEKAMVDEEEGTSPCNSSISTSPEQPAEKPVQEEEPSQTNSSISTALQVQVPVCEEDKCLTDEEGASPCTSRISTSPQQPAEKPTQEEEPSQSDSSISTDLQVQVSVCEDESLSDEGEEEEGTRTKFGFKLVFLLLCLVSSVCYISYLSSNVEMKLHARTNEVSVLGEMLGLSKMCLGRRNADLTCGVEEWVMVMEKSEEFIPTGTPEEEEMISGGELEFDLTGTPEGEDIFTGGELDVIKETNGIETDIGMLAQGNTVESSEMELHVVEDEHIFERSEPLKMQVYLLYSMQALVAGLSVLTALIAYLRKHTSNKVHKRRKQTQASETDVEKDSGALKKSSDHMSTTIVENSKMYVIQTSEVDLLDEPSFANTTTMVNGSSVKKGELQAMNVVNTSMEKSSLKESGATSHESSLQATPTAPRTPQASLEKTEKNNNLREATTAVVTPLRRSSRLRSRSTSS